jgi:hypothetical protein
MATDKPKAKTLYHSALVKLGPVMVTVKSDVSKSKFAGKPDYCYLVINGEEFGYSFDSPACQQFFTGQKGRSFMIQAEGRDADAKIIYLGEPGSQKLAAPVTLPPAAQPPPVNQPPAQHAPPPPPPQQRQAAPAATPPTAGSPPPPPGANMSNEEALKQTKVFIARRASLLKVAIVAVHSLDMEFQKLAGRKMSDDEFFWNTRLLYMSAESQGISIRAGFADRMPTNIDLETLQIVKAAHQPPAA